MSPFLESALACGLGLYARVQHSWQRGAVEGVRLLPPVYSSACRRIGCGTGIFRPKYSRVFSPRAPRLKSYSAP